MARMQSHSTSNASSIAQWASIEALDNGDDEVRRRLGEFSKRRDEVVRLLSEVDGVTCLTPEGAFYAFPNVSGLFGRTTANGPIRSGAGPGGVPAGAGQRRRRARRCVRCPAAHSRVLRGFARPHPRGCSAHRGRDRQARALIFDVRPRAARRRLHRSPRTVGRRPARRSCSTSATACPTVYFGDSGELIAAADSLGVAHPPGYPIYTLLGRVALLLPIGEAAWRMNVLSAVLGAIACALAARLVQRWTDSAIAAVGSGLGLAAAYDVWVVSTVAEVYTLHLFLIASLLLLADRMHDARETRDLRRLLLMAAFVLGLGLSHRPTIVLALPAAAALAIGRARRVRLLRRAGPADVGRGYRDRRGGSARGVRVVADPGRCGPGRELGPSGRSRCPRGPRHDT